MEILESKSLSQKELQLESKTLGNVEFGRLLMLDIDSFFVFANVLLDHVPFFLRPICKGIVIECDIGKNQYLSQIKINGLKLLISDHNSLSEFS